MGERRPGTRVQSLAPSLLGLHHPHYFLLFMLLVHPNSDRHTPCRKTTWYSQAPSAASELGSPSLRCLSQLCEQWFAILSGLVKCYYSPEPGPYRFTSLHDAPMCDQGGLIFSLIHQPLFLSSFPLSRYIPIRDKVDFFFSAGFRPRPNRSGRGLTIPERHNPGVWFQAFTNQTRP